ncbi:MAG: glycosyltransferase family 39 protein [Verrucomicrobiota bacterium]
MTGSRQAGAVLIGLILLGALFRFAWLGEAAFRADTIDFYTHAKEGRSIADVWTNPDWVEHMPLAETSVLLFHQLFNLEVNLDSGHTTVRIPFALMGTLTLLAIFFFTRSVLKAKVALVAVFLAAMNPYHLHLSREAYHYVGVTLFSSCTLWMFWRVWNDLLDERVLKLKPFLGWSVFGLIMLHTHLATWSTLGVQWLLLSWAGWRSLRTDRRQLLRLELGLGVLGLAILVVIVPVIRGVLAELLPRLAEKHPAHGGQWLNLLKLIVTFPFAFTFGTGILGVLLSIAVLNGMPFCAAKSTSFRRLMLLLLLEGLSIILITAVIGKGKAKYSYFAPLWPMVMVLCSMGVFGWLHFVSGSNRRRVFQAAILGLVAVYCGVAIKANWRSTGRPKPYKEILAWCNETLPQGAPVLVDRWFEPWNEFKVYASTNVHFTFTVPDEPLEAFKRNRWRTTVKDFCRKNPDTAYIELSKNYFDEPDIGPWTWPKSYFARHEQIRNEPGILLQRMGLNFRPGGRWMYEGLVVDIYYNTREDMMRKMAKKRQFVFHNYGRGWGYEKDERLNDWRTMKESAELQLIHVAQTPIVIELSLKARTKSGTKTVAWSGNPEMSHVFTSNAVQEWAVGRINVSTGIKSLNLTDPAWKRDRQPLLVEEVIIRPVRVGKKPVS